MILLLVAACAASSPDLYPVSDVSVEGAVLTVWVADTPEERRQGLRGVEAMPDQVDGMLFVFSPAAFPVFVMEDTLIPLDLWLFDPEGRLVDQVEMVPCPVRPCPRYPASRPVGWALETPAGEFGFEPGAELATSP